MLWQHIYADDPFYKTNNIVINLKIVHRRLYSKKLTVSIEDLNSGLCRVCCQGSENLAHNSRGRLKKLVRSEKNPIFSKRMNITILKLHLRSQTIFFFLYLNRSKIAIRSWQHWITWSPRQARPWCQRSEPCPRGTLFY
jgi:hypothetical protein